MWFFWGSNTLGKHQLKDLGKLAHKTWTAWAVLHVACRMSTRLLRNIPVFFAFRNSNSWLNALEIRLNTHTQNTVKHRRKLATQQMGRPRKRCEGHATHKNRRMKKWKNSRAVTGGVTLFFSMIVCMCLHRVCSLSGSTSEPSHTANIHRFKLGRWVVDYAVLRFSIRKSF